MFHYLFKNINTLLSGFTIKQDVITFFYRMTDYGGGMELPQLSLNLFTRAKQCEAPCEGVGYHNLEEGNFQHEVRELHSTDLPEQLAQNNTHIHQVTCGLVTPDKLRCLLQQLIEVQADKKAREAFMHSPEAQQYQFFAKLLIGKELRMDTETNLFDPAELKQIIAAYENYYNKNRIDMEANYNETQSKIRQYMLDSTWLDEFVVLTDTAWRAAKQSAMLSFSSSFFYEVLITAGAPKQVAGYLAHGLNLSLMAYMGTSWYPVIAASTVLAVAKIGFQAQDNVARISSGVAGVLATIAEQFPMDGFGVLNLGVALLSSTASSVATQYVTHSSFEFLRNYFGFFPAATAVDDQGRNNQRNDIEERKIKLH